MGKVQRLDGSGRGVFVALRLRYSPVPLVRVFVTSSPHHPYNMVNERVMNSDGVMYNMTHSPCKRDRRREQMLG